MTTQTSNGWWEKPKCAVKGRVNLSRQWSSIGVKFMERCNPSHKFYGCRGPSVCFIKSLKDLHITSLLGSNVQYSVMRDKSEPGEHKSHFYELYMPGKYEIKENFPFYPPLGGVWTAI
jgi:hypothetical protein